MDEAAGPSAKRAKVDPEASANGTDGGASSTAQLPEAAATGPTTVVRIRGLNWQSSEEAVYRFFTGLDAVPDSAFLIRDARGRPSGEAYVRFTSTDEQAKALQRHRQYLDNRYIEVISDTEEAYETVGWSGRGGRGRRGRKSERQRIGKRCCSSQHFLLPLLLLAEPGSGQEVGRRSESQSSGGAHAGIVVRDD